MVTIDASPMNQHAKEASNEWVKQPPPFWAIHTSYRQDERFRKIQDFNELLTQQIHKGLDVSPAAQTRSRTCEPAPTGTEGVSDMCGSATRHRPAPLRTTGCFSTDDVDS